jgi:preprotein translocase subunit YajC
MGVAPQPLGLLSAVRNARRPSRPRTVYPSPGSPGSPATFRTFDPMFITPAFAQAAPAGGSPLDTFPFVLLLVMAIVFFLVIRPQQKRAKEFQDMIAKVRRGDTVVTAGGFVATVSKVTEGSDEIEVQLNDTMKVRVLKTTLISVKSKNEPVKEST